MLDGEIDCWCCEFRVGSCFLIACVVLVRIVLCLLLCVFVDCCLVVILFYLTVWGLVAYLLFCFTFVVVVFIYVFIDWTWFVGCYLTVRYKLRVCDFGNKFVVKVLLVLCFIVCVWLLVAVLDCSNWLTLVFVCGCIVVGFISVGL